MVSLFQWCQEQDRPEFLECYLAGGNPLPPDQVGFSSGKAVRWRCPDCGMAWLSAPNKMNRKPRGRSICPFCSHERPSPRYNAALIYPEMLEYWDEDANPAPLAEYLPGSKQATHWQCPRGHRWIRPIIDQAQAILRRRAFLEEDLCPYCSRKRPSPDYNLALVCPEAASQWYQPGNGDLTPCDISPYSTKKAAWQCSFDPAHIWTDRISNRTILLRGCPECSRRSKISYGARALYYYLQQAGLLCEYEVPAGRYRIDIVVRPRDSGPIALELDGYLHRAQEAAQRDARKDTFLREQGYRIIRVKELAEDSGEVRTQDNTVCYPRSDQNRYLNRVIRQTLLLVAGVSLQPDHVRDHWKIEELYDSIRREQSLAALFPELSRQWSPRNVDTPQVVSPGLSTNRWWVCPRCRREYQATVANRSRHHSGCPYCAHTRVTPETSLAAQFPQIAAQWDWEKNAPLTPADVLPGTGKRVWWRCSQGHSWQTAVCMRTGPKATQCPYCRGRLVTAETSLAGASPELSLYWHPTKNPVPATQVAPFSNRRAWWRCPEGHEWQAPVNKARKYPPGRICPYCHHRRIRGPQEPVTE